MQRIRKLLSNNDERLGDVIVVIRSETAIAAAKLPHVMLTGTSGRASLGETTGGNKVPIQLSGSSRIRNVMLTPDNTLFSHSALFVRSNGLWISIPKTRIQAAWALRYSASEVSKTADQVVAEDVLGASGVTSTSFGDRGELDRASLHSRLAKVDDGKL